MKQILLNIICVFSCISAFAFEQPYTSIAELIMKYGSGAYGESVFHKLGLPLYSKLGDNNSSSAFDGKDMNGKYITAKLEREKDSSKLAYIAFVVDTCYYDNIIHNLLDRGYIIYDEDREDRSYGYGTIAHQKIFKSDKVMCIVQTGNNYLKGKIYLYYTYRYNNSNLIQHSLSDVLVEDFNVIFDPKNETDTDWNCTEIDPEWLEDVGIYYDTERHNFFELKPFYELRNSTLSPFDNIEDYVSIIQQPAVYNTLEPIRRINASKSHILEYLNQIEYIRPQFPGGDEALWKFIQKNFKMPKNCNIDENIYRPRVEVAFDIDENGKIINIHIIRSVSPEIDKEFVRVIKSLPNFTPGTADGKPHKFTGYRIPLNIKTQE